MKANINVPATSAEQLIMNLKTKRLADKVKRIWCAYYDPDRRPFGKRSRCVECCCNGLGTYSPNQLDTDCKRANILNNCLPTFTEAVEKYIK